MGKGRFLLRLMSLVLIIGLSGCSGVLSQTKSEPIEKGLREKSEKNVPSKIKTAESPPLPQPPVSPTPPLTSIAGPAPSIVTPTSASPPMPSSVSPPVQASTLVRPTEPRPGPSTVFNFDNADIYEVIRVMAEVMKINYVVDPRVRGVVNIRTTSPISGDEVFSVFQSILRLNGATAVKKENFYEIIPFGEAKKLPIPLADRIEPGRPITDGRYLIQIIPLKYIPVAEVSKMLRPFLSDGADIVEHPPHNILILGDVASNVRKALDIIALFDLDVFADLRVRIYPILNADVAEIAKEIERIFSSFEVSVKSGRGVGITFTPITRINSLLVVSSIPGIFEKVEGWLKELDRAPAEGTKLGVHVYYVQNMKAKELSDVLKQIFVTVKDKKTEFKDRVTPSEPAPRGVKPAPAPVPTPPKEEPSPVPEGEINIVVDETNNALVIRAFERDYRTILETIKKLDIYPRQVLIELLLVDIILNDDTQYGIEFMRFLDTLSHGRFQQTINLGPFVGLPKAGPGITYSIVEQAGRFAAAIKAAASEGRLRVITSPHLIASNNREAKIQIGTAEPILTGIYTATTAPAAADVVETPIEYKDIGTILTVTPRISDGGLVTMEIAIEESSLDSRELGIRGRTLIVPAFNKTVAKTILSIIEGQTIAIGGLFRDTKDVSRSGVPILSKIPLLGSLFGTNTRAIEKREMILLLTPHIIKGPVQSKSVTEELKEKLEGIKKVLESFEKR